MIYTVCEKGKLNIACDTDEVDNKQVARRIDAPDKKLFAQPRE